ncbi:MAG: DUF1102 domain-containing protein [Archaeoglobaceae archaeon]
MKKAIGVLLLMLGLTLSIGAGANFKYYEAERSVTVNITSDDLEFLDLKPAQPYAYLDNGKLTIEISPNNPNFPGYGRGMSHNTTYVFEEMFNVSNEFWENNDTERFPDGFPVCVWISIAGDSGVKIFAGEYDTGTATIAGPDTQIKFTVYHGQDVPVGFVFDNTCKSSGGSVQMSIVAFDGECPT